MSDPAGRPPSVPEVPDVAVVGPVRNSEATLADAVASVLAQELDGTLEVCIAVGPSDDRTREVADGLADAVLVESERWAHAPSMSDPCAAHLVARFLDGEPPPPGPARC